MTEGFPMLLHIQYHLGYELLHIQYHLGYELLRIQCHLGLCAFRLQRWIIEKSQIQSLNSGKGALFG